MYDYVILDIGKIIIIRENKNVIYKKEINNNMVSLTEIELRYVKELFKKDNSNIYYSDYLNEIIENNDSIMNNEPQYLLRFLNLLEKIVPENYKNNYYDNLKTLQVNLNFDVIKNPPLEETFPKSSNLVEYNVIDNTIVFDKGNLLAFYNLSKTQGDPNAFFWKNINRNFLHELFHMASSKRNEKNNTYKCGITGNRALTEGMTELFTNSFVESANIQKSVYFIETAIVKQLMCITGDDVFINSYFGNEDTSLIEGKLNIETNNEDIIKTFNLLDTVEDSYCLRYDNHQQNLLGNIQSTIIDYLDTSLTNNYKSPEEIKVILDDFEKVLITKEKLKENNPENSDKYLDISKSVFKFYKLKEKYITKGVSKK